MSRWIGQIFLVLSFVACQHNPGQLTGEKVKVVCTTGMIADAATALLGDLAEVDALMGSGVDPHLYKATQGDIEALMEADIIIYNGLHLEGKMTDIFAQLERTKKVFAMGELVDTSALINSTDYEDAYDPHIWFDVALWSEAVAGLSEGLQNFREDWQKPVALNTQKYLARLQELDREVKQGIRKIPEQQRVLITAHDAFKYFGRAYGLEVMGLQGISTTSEYGLRDISNLVQFVTDHEIRAIFVESSVPRRSVEAVIEGAGRRGHQLQLGGELFSDAMGAKDSPEGTYPGMVRHNVAIIVNALK